MKMNQSSPSTVLGPLGVDLHVCSNGMQESNVHDVLLKYAHTGHIYA